MPGIALTSCRLARRLALWAGLAALLSTAATAQQNVQITNLTDVGFGTIVNPEADVSQSQTVCVYSGLILSLYAIKFTGSGVGGAFTLTNGGGATLPYEVQWNAAPGQLSGTAVTSGSTLSSQLSVAVTPTCTLGVTPSGSLTVILRGTELSRAAAGTFTGTLTLMISPN